MKHIILGMTGASGTVYGLRLLDVLLQTECRVHLVVSPAWKLSAQHEWGSGDWEQCLHQQRNHWGVPPVANCPIVYSCDDFAARIASGSAMNAGAVIAPCSGSSLGSIAAGVNRHLIHRVAEVQLKERRPLILLVRESPLSLIHLQNMERITLAGGIILPACPHFYTENPGTVNDAVDTVAARTLDLLGLEHNIGLRYSPSNKDSDDTAR